MTETEVPAQRVSGDLNSGEPGLPGSLLSHDGARNRASRCTNLVTRLISNDRDRLRASRVAPKRVYVNQDFCLFNDCDESDSFERNSCACARTGSRYWIGSRIGYVRLVVADRRERRGVKSEPTLSRFPTIASPMQSPFCVSVISAVRPAYIISYK